MKTGCLFLELHLREKKKPKENPRQNDALAPLKLSLGSGEDNQFAWTED